MAATEYPSVCGGGAMGWRVGVDSRGTFTDICLFDDASGAIEVNGVRIDARDGAAIADETTLTVTAIEDAEIVLVDAE